MKTIHIREKNSCLEVKSLKEKILKIPHHLFMVFKTLIVSFPPKTPHNARQKHLPHRSILKPTTLPFLACEKVYYSIRQNPSLKMVFHRALAI